MTQPHETPGQLLRWYIDKYESAYGQSTLPFADRLRRVMTPAARLRAKQIATRADARRARRTAAELAARPGPLKLHLGCGWNRLDGWVNIDLVGAKTDLVWDLRVPLPFADGSVDAVFAEHVFEHMTYGETLHVLAHVHRALKPGGALRVGVPDAGIYARQYVEDPSGIKDLRWGRATPMLALREVFQEHAHVAAYDEETLVLVLAEGGFPGARRTDPGTSRLLDPVPDLAERWAETVYVEATC